jgi:flagellar biosynthesis/type III secretory pathway protein FliH
LSVYIVITTKLTDKDVNELVEQLPIETKQEFMTAYDNILEKGREIGLEQGLEIGSKRGEDKKSIEFAIKLLKESLPDNLVLILYDISKEVLVILKKVILDDFQTKTTQTELAKSLIEHYEYLRDEDVAIFSKLELDEIRSLRVVLSKMEKR